MLPGLHHSGGTVCEPVDLPVTKRHLEMVYAHMRSSDKPFMGSVTAASRAADTVEMCKILFGDEFVSNNCVTVSLINANSPMTWDDTMLGALKVYARANQGTVISPFHSGWGDVTCICWRYIDTDIGGSDVRNYLCPGRESWCACDFWQFRQLDFNADRGTNLWHAGTSKGAIWLLLNWPSA